MSNFQPDADCNCLVRWKIKKRDGIGCIAGQKDKEVREPSHHGRFLARIKAIKVI